MRDILNLRTLRFNSSMQLASRLKMSWYVSTLDWPRTNNGLMKVGDLPEAARFNARLRYILTVTYWARRLNVLSKDHTDPLCVRRNGTNSCVAAGAQSTRRHMGRARLTCAPRGQTWRSMPSSASVEPHLRSSDDVLSAPTLVPSAWSTLLYRARTGDDVVRCRRCPRSGTTCKPVSASRGWRAAPVGALFLPEYAHMA